MRVNVKDALNKKFDPLHYKHNVTVYVPCFQKNPTNDNDASPSFEYCLGDGSSDINEALSLKPDYVLVLKGEFNAMTQPFDLNIVRHNNNQWVSEEY